MNSMNRVWPNFYIVGAGKCGTGSLYEHLKKHPQVFLPEIKEQNFFSTPPPPGENLGQIRYCGDLEEFQSLYRGAERFGAIGEVSPSHLYDKNACYRIFEVCPQAKIIIMLRDPVARAFSHFLFNQMNLIEHERSFRKALELEAALPKVTWHSGRGYASFGRYYEQVRRYIDTFGRDQVLVLLFDEFMKNPQEIMTRIAHHIGIDPGLFDARELSQVHNAYRMPRSKLAYRIAGKLGLRTKLLPPAVRWWLNHNPLLFDRKKPQIDNESRRVLQDMYRPDVAGLEELLGRKLPELRKSWT